MPSLIYGGIFVYVGVNGGIQFNSVFGGASYWCEGNGRTNCLAVGVRMLLGCLVGVCRVG